MRLLRSRVGGPSNGTAVAGAVPGTIDYTPAPGFVGTDSFTYEICSPNDATLCDQATVTIVVTAAPPQPTPTPTPTPTPRPTAVPPTVAPTAPPVPPTDRGPFGALDIGEAVASTLLLLATIGGVALLVLAVALARRRSRPR